MRAILILFAAIFIGCSPSHRLAMLVKRHPELVSKDTVMISDTTLISSVEKDTSFIFSQLTDTFLVEKERLKIKIIRDHDTLRVEGKCDSIIVIKEIPVEIHTVQPPKPISWWQCVLMYIGGIVLIIVALYFGMKQIRSRLPL